jgi:MFS family permease
MYVEAGERRIVRALGWVSFLTDVASDMVYPLLPGFLTRTLKAGPAALGIIEGVAEATSAAAKVVSGRLSDRSKRRKPLVVFGYALAAAARPLVAAAQSWAAVLAIRFADRIGKGVRSSPRDALLADIVPPQRRGRAYGLQRAMDNAGAVVGPLLAALLLKFVVSDVRTVFLLSVIPGGLALVVLALFVREPARSVSDAVHIKAPPSREALPGRFWRFVAVFSLFALANSTDAFLLLRAGDAGVPAWQIPLLWAAFHAAKAAAGVPGGAMADRLGRIPTITAGWIVYAAAYAGFALANGPAAAWSLFLLYALFYALTEGPERALIADLVPERLRGRAFGAFHAAVGLAALPGSVIFGLLWKSFGHAAAFFTGAALALAAAVLLRWANRSRPREANS